jgi:hypothetical protein
MWLTNGQASWVNEGVHVVLQDAPHQTQKELTLPMQDWQVVNWSQLAYVIGTLFV